MNDLRPLVVGNWKMNGLASSSSQIRSLLHHLREAPPDCDVVVCPPYTLLMPFSLVFEGYPISLGAQDCHTEEDGAHTGDISAGMLKDAGCSYVIVGHSERRSAHGETSALVRAKAMAAQQHGMAAIICVGESESDRDGGLTIEKVAEQLRESIPDEVTGQNTVIAYEPVWAIGTGRTPNNDQIAEVHATIRMHLSGRFGDNGAGIRVLYGGSVNSKNARQIFSVPKVDGALVGGASLGATDFDAILDAYRPAT